MGERAANEMSPGKTSVSAAGTGLTVVGCSFSLRPCSIADLERLGVRLVTFWKEASPPASALSAMGL